jgi:hypothetical protein
MKKYVLIILTGLLFTAVKSQSLLTVAEIFDYNVGDVFITKAGGISSPPTFEKKIITNKYYSAFSDTLFYNFDSYSYTWQACPTCSAIYDTLIGGLLTYTNLNDSVGSGLGAKIHYWSPTCIDTAGYTGIWLDTIINDTSICNKQVVRISRMDNGPQLTDSCYSYFEPYYGYEEYGKGIGRKTYYYNSCANGPFPPCEEKVSLVFYKKGTDSCGIAPLMSNLNELSFTSSFKLFPNPFKTETNLTFVKEQINSVITLTNTLGEEVRKFNFSGRQLTIERGNLKKGIYFIQVNDRKNFYTSKIIVQ